MFLVKCPAKDGRTAVLLPNPKSRCSFYICSNGRPIKQNCPRGLEFNPLLKVCDWPRRRVESLLANNESEDATETEETSVIEETTEDHDTIVDGRRRE